VEQASIISHEIASVATETTVHPRLPFLSITLPSRLVNILRGHWFCLSCWERRFSDSKQVCRLWSRWIYEQLRLRA